MRTLPTLIPLILVAYLASPALVASLNRVEIEPGLSLYVQRFGRGPAVVFVHAGGMTHEAWDHQTAALMTRFETVTYDLRGIGRSDVPVTGYTIDHHAEDLGRLIERLSLKTPAIVAHGVGAHVALRFAARHSALLSRLVLISAAPWSVGDRGSAEGGISGALWATMQDGLAVNRAEADLDLIVRQYFHRPPGEGLRAWCLQMALGWPLPVLQQLIAGMQELDHREALPRIRVPVLVAHGRHDRKNRYEGGVTLSRLLPDARLVTFEDSAVCPQLEEVQRFNAVLGEFLDAGRSTAAG